MVIIIKQMYKCLLRHTSSRSSRRIRRLAPAIVSIPQDNVTEPKVSYLVEREKIKLIGNWQLLAFDQLCRLPPQTFAFLELEVRKDKFNIPDDQFKMAETSVAPELSPYYARVYALLSGHHQLYDELREEDKDSQEYEKYIRNCERGYLAEMYMMDLEKDKALASKIEWFINSLTEPAKLDCVAEPSFAKYLLSLKRELLLQGAQFPQFKSKRLIRYRQEAQPLEKSIQLLLQRQIASQYESEDNIVQYKKQQEQEADTNSFISKKHRKQDSNKRYSLESSRMSQPKLKVIRVVNYEYQFWVDVKFNRSHNIDSKSYIIEQTQIENMNQFSRDKKIKVTYIVHRKKREDFEMHFVIKSTMIVKLPTGSQRIVKVQWKGPSKQQNGIGFNRDYKIIDYEGLMRGNPTIKPIFMF